MKQYFWFKDKLLWGSGMILLSMIIVTVWGIITYDIQPTNQFFSSKV